MPNHTVGAEKKRPTSKITAKNGKTHTFQSQNTAYAGKKADLGICARVQI